MSAKLIIGRRSILSKRRVTTHSQQARPSQRRRRKTIFETQTQVFVHCYRQKMPTQLYPDLTPFYSRLPTEDDGPVGNKRHAKNDNGTRAKTSFFEDIRNRLTGMTKANKREGMNKSKRREEVSRYVSNESHSGTGHCPITPTAPPEEEVFETDEAVFIPMFHNSASVQGSNTDSNFEEPLADYTMETTCCEDSLDTSSNNVSQNHNSTCDVNDEVVVSTQNNLDHTKAVTKVPYSKNVDVWKLGSQPKHNNIPANGSSMDQVVTDIRAHLKSGPFVPQIDAEKSAKPEPSKATTSQCATLNSGHKSACVAPVTKRDEVNLNNLSHATSSGLPQGLHSTAPDSQTVDTSPRNASQVTQRPKPSHQNYMAIDVSQSDKAQPQTRPNRLTPRDNHNLTCGNDPAQLNSPEEYQSWVTWRKEMNCHLSGMILLRPDRAQEMEQFRQVAEKQPSKSSMDKMFQKAKRDENTALKEKTYIMYGIPRVKV